MSRKPGCRIQWDHERALEMWKQKMRTADIAEAVNVSEAALIAAAFRYRWPRRIATPRKAPARANAGQGVIIRGEVTKRCPRCLSVYTADIDNPTPHCFKPITHSFYIETGYALEKVAA